MIVITRGNKFLVRGRRPWFQVSLQHSFERSGRNEGNAYSPVVVKKKLKEIQYFQIYFPSSPFQNFSHLEFLIDSYLSCSSWYSQFTRQKRNWKYMSWHLPVLVLTPTSSFPFVWTCKCFLKNNFLRSSSTFRQFLKSSRQKYYKGAFGVKEAWGFTAWIRRFVLEKAKEGSFITNCNVW